MSCVVNEGVRNGQESLVNGKSQAELVWSNGYLNDEQCDLIMDIEETTKLIVIIKEYAKSNPYMIIKANKLDWRNRRGHKLVDLSQNDGDIRYDIVPDDDGVTFELYKEPSGDLYALVSSHDIPTGATWHFTPAVDVDDTLLNIADQLYNKEDATLIDLATLLEEKLGINIESWSTEYEYHNTVQIGGMITVHLENDRITGMITYDADSIAHEYTKRILGY